MVTYSKYVAYTIAILILDGFDSLVNYLRWSSLRAKLEVELKTYTNIYIPGLVGWYMGKVSLTRTLVPGEWWVARFIVTGITGASKKYVWLGHKIKTS